MGSPEYCRTAAPCDDQAIEAAVVRRHRDRDHLALELAQARRRQHQVVIHRDEGFELRHVEGIGLQHVRHEAELLLAFGEIGRHRFVERDLGQRQRDHDASSFARLRRGKRNRVAGCLPGDGLWQQSWQTSWICHAAVICFRVRKPLWLSSRARANAAFPVPLSSPCRSFSSIPHRRQPTALFLRQEMRNPNNAAAQAPSHAALRES